MSITAVIFDLDGVIISTDEYHYLAWKKIFDSERIPFDRSVNERLRGMSRLESLEIGLEKANRKYGAEEKSKLADSKNSYYRELLTALSDKDILPGVIDGIDWLKRMKIKTAIASSSKNARLILEKIGLETYFDAVVDGTEIKKSKPDPELFLKSAEKLGENPSRCMVVEDALSGIIAAKAARMMAVGIGYAASLREPDYTIKSVVEIPRIVDRINSD